MRTVFVMRQVMGVMDSLMREATRRVQLSPEDALVLGWLVQEHGLSGSDLGAKLRRSRQSVHRTLSRLESRGLVERLPSSIDGKTAGWLLTEAGRKDFDRIERWFAVKEQELDGQQIKTEEFAKALTNLMQVMINRPKPRRELGFTEPERDWVADEWEL